jgi:transcriptional regulator with XRE-family HTH domain
VNGKTGSRIKQLRERKGWTQLDLALKVGINNSVLSRIESNKRPVESQELKKIAEVFEVTTDYLLGKDNRHPAEKLKEYLDMELTDEEIMERMNFKVDNLALSNEEVKEFIAFVRGKRFMMTGQQASVSKPEEP